MAKKTVETFKKLLGYDGRKADLEKALLVLEEIGVNAENESGETPLILAAYLGGTSILKILIERVNDIDYQNPDTFCASALLEACGQRRLESIKLLVEAGADLEQNDRFGNTPLSKVFTNTFSDPIPSATYLLSKGAKITDRVIKTGKSWNEELFNQFLKESDSGYEYTLVKKGIVPVPAEQPLLDIALEHNSVNNKDYNATARLIWKKLVPGSGQAETVQGELLRAIEKLRDEARRNGNGNFNKNCHVILIKFLRSHLSDVRVFDNETLGQINADLDRLLKKNYPYTDEDLYDRMTVRIVDWYLQNPALIMHPKNPALCC